MTDVTHVSGVGMSELCAMVGHGLKIVYADSAGNLYSVDTNEAVTHSHDGGE